MQLFQELFLLLLNMFILNAHRNDVLLITNFAKQQDASKVLLYTCWNKTDVLNLWKECWKQGISISTAKKFSATLNKVLFVADAKCNNFNSLLHEVTDLFKFPYLWLILHEIPANISLKIDSRVTVATKTKDSYSLSLIYKLEEELIRNHLAIFSDGKFKYYNYFSVPQNRSDLKGQNVTVSYVQTDTSIPFDLTDYRFHHIDGVSKLSYIAVYLMLETLNCTKVFIRRKGWGGYKPNDEGMFTDVRQGTAEIAGTAAFYTAERQKMVEYVALTTPSNMKFILKAPSLSYVQNLFVLPFETKVWYSLYFIVAISVLVLFAIVVAENRYRIEGQDIVSSIKPKVSDVVMVQLGAITQQGSDAQPKSIAGRIAFFVIFLVLMFLYTAYSASIVVLLQSTSSSIQSVEDLLNSKIALGVEDIVYSRPNFESQNESVRRAIYERKIAPKGQKGNFFKVDDGIRKVKEQFFAFHIETTSGYKVVMDTFQEHEKCGLIEVDYLNQLWPSVSMRKNSNYRELFKFGFRRIYENGLYNRHMNRIYTKKPQCTSKGGTFVNVGIIDAYFAFVVFCVGTAASVVMFSLEVLLFKLIRNKYKE